MSAPTTTLRGDEYEVVSHFADGLEDPEIAGLTGLERDRINGILVRKCQRNRDRARALVNGGATIATDHEARAALASPLTAPLPAKTAAAAKVRAAHDPPRPAGAAQATTRPRVPATQPDPPAPVLAEPVVTDADHVSPPRPSGADAREVVVRAPAGLVKPIPVPPPAEPTWIEALLHQADTIDVPRVRHLAEKVRLLVDSLRDIVAEEVQLRGARERIAQLERELDIAYALLPPAAKAEDKHTARRMRKWASDNDVACPPTGRVPRVVQAAYRKATGDGGDA